MLLQHTILFVDTICYVELGRRLRQTLFHVGLEARMGTATE